MLSDRGVLDWEEYREIPKRLLEVGILSQQLADELARAAGMRNILVHMYLEVDPVLVHDTVRDHLDVFHEFAERVLAELGSG